MHYNKVCDLTDWDAPEIKRIMEEELHLPDDSQEKKERKHWEWAMGFHALQNYGFLNRDNKALGLGSGHEAIIYALANHLQSVTATDLYGKTPFSSMEANPRVLEDPSIFCSFPYDRKRLLIRRMNATQIDYPDSHFDIVFSFSSIEHFGNDRSILQAMMEAYRVIKPGGIYVLSIDYIFQNPWPPLPRRWRRKLAGELLDRNDVRRLLVDGTGFRAKQEIRFDVFPEKITNTYDIVSKLSSSGKLHPHIYLSYPRALRIKRLFGNYLFSSLFLALFKHDNGHPSTPSRS